MQKVLAKRVNDVDWVVSTAKGRRKSFSYNQLIEFVTPFWPEFHISEEHLLQKSKSWFQIATCWYCEMMWNNELYGVALKYNPKANTFNVGIVRPTKFEEK